MTANGNRAGLKNAETILDYPFFAELAALPFIEMINLFGRWAEGSNDPREVIDLGIYCPNATQEDWAAALAVIENSTLLVPVKAVRIDNLDANSPLRQRLYDGNILLYKKTPASYLDALPQARELMQWHLKVLRDALGSSADEAAILNHFRRALRHFWHFTRYALTASGVQAYTPAATLRHAYMAGWLEDRQAWEELLSVWMQLLPEGTEEVRQRALSQMDEFVVMMDTALTAVMKSSEFRVQSSDG